MACTDNVMRALFLLALFCVMHGEKEESKRIDAKASGPGGSFDITKLGASGNGIHMGDSSGITITNTVISVSDDCISFGPGTSKVNITGVTYGSGHGISIGSLGRYKDEKDDTNINVKDVTFKNITGTSSTPEAVSLLCSAKIPCTGVTMDDINVEYSGTNNKTMAICTNAKGSTKGCLKELACF
ncbi:Pectin lyase-like superfamily protein [Zea mays]|uniref:Pectin lyase-like superfamily protein n=1 Tax=Zea mays TaxID=4577 RepID=A0A1D6LRL2_MAIZE|nr:Pectin lyase-like superfamily protein [Zea mays]